MQDLRLNPEQRLDLVVAGTKDAVMMVESEAYELSEAEMLGAVNFAHEHIQPVIDLIVDLAEDCAKEPFDFQPADYSELSALLKLLAKKTCAQHLRSQTSKSARSRQRCSRSDQRRSYRRAACRCEPWFRDEGP